jgi:hypothetical protein
MIEKFPKSILRPHMGPLVFLLIIFGSATSALCMDSHTEEKSEMIKSALIKDKGDYGVLIDGRQYGITESTIILDLMGKDIPLCDLPIPCEALVEFRITEVKNPVLLRIEVKRLLEDSKDSS